MPRTCSRCRHWQRTHPLSEVGRCRRYPPIAAEIEAKKTDPPRLVVLPDWPTTLANDRCGEFMSNVLPAVYPSYPSAN